MRRLCLILTMLATVCVTSAQRLWSEYDVRQRQNILSSKQVPGIIRESIETLTSIDDSTRATLWQIVTTPTKDKRVASLYLYLYESLRPYDASYVAEDATIIKSYPAYMLARWSEDAHSHDVIEYAHSLGCYVAEGHSAQVVAALRPLSKRRYRKSYGEVIATLRRGIEVAAESHRLGEWLTIDHTIPESIEQQPYIISAEAYDNAEAAIKPYGTSYTEQESIVESIAAHCISCGDGYYMPCGALGRDITAIEAWADSDTKCFAIVDRKGVCHTLPAPLYILDNGVFYAICDDDNHYIVVGSITDGNIDIYGSVRIGEITAGSIKCNANGLYMRSLDRYLHLTI